MTLGLTLDTMPHASHMKEKNMEPRAGALFRARLHIRSGRRRIRQGLLCAGILTLYDALSAATEYAVLTQGGRIPSRYKDELAHDDKAFHALRHCGLLDSSFDHKGFLRLVDRAIEANPPESYDWESLLLSLDSVMTQLGVMPFDEGSLPPEDPTILQGE